MNRTGEPDQFMPRYRSTQSLMHKSASQAESIKSGSTDHA
jgi:hypothetical protein